MTDIITEAQAFAAFCHKDQVRKWTGEPYIVHPARVAAMIEHQVSGTMHMIAAAWLHDVVEDCGVSLGRIEHDFGELIFVYVEQLTAPNEPTTATTQSIKLADIADNCENIAEVAPPAEALEYLRRKRGQVDSFSKGNTDLWHIASRRIERGLLIAARRMENEGDA